MALNGGVLSLRDASGCGVEVAVSFPFLAAPSPDLLRGRTVLPEFLSGAGPSEGRDPLVRALAAHIPAAAPSRVYVGNETCEKLIPPLPALETWLAAAGACGWAVSLVLPPLGREGLEKAEACARLLVNVPGAEVVASDWGAVHRLRTRFPDLEIVLGRLTHKMLRDPRLADRFDCAAAPRGARAALCRSGEASAGFRALLSEYRIARREIDPYLQPLPEEEWEGRPESLSVYLPYLFVTMGRSCLLAAFGRNRENMFVPGAECLRECRRYAVEFQIPDVGGAGRGTRLVQLGNAVYHALPAPDIERVVARVARSGRADRIVVTIPAARGET